MHLVTAKEHQNRWLELPAVAADCPAAAASALAVPASPCRAADRHTHTIKKQIRLAKCCKVVMAESATISCPPCM